MEQLVFSFQSPKDEDTIDAIEELKYVENYIGENEQSELLKQVDKGPWLNDLKRRVQHYGFMYDYKARKVTHDMCIGHLPDWLKTLSQKLHKDGYMPADPDQVIVNEYEPGQGITSHIDCEPCFADTIVSLSLGSGCVMDFTYKHDKTKKIPVWLAPKSIIVLKGEARYKWLHSIPARKVDVWKGQNYPRQRRVSLTFREMKIGADSPVCVQSIHIRVRNKEILAQENMTEYVLASGLFNFVVKQLEDNADGEWHYRRYDSKFARGVYRSYQFTNLRGEVAEVAIFYVPYK